MSVDYYLVCHTCKEHVHVAHDGLSGFSFYQPNGKLRKFVALHTLERNHKAATLEIINEHTLESDAFEDYMAFE